jgi:hypothetical protein
MSAYQRHREAATRSTKYKAKIQLLEICMYAYKILVGKPEGTRRLERNGVTIKWNKTGCEVEDYTRNAQDKDHAEEFSGPMTE